MFTDDFTIKGRFGKAAGISSHTCYTLFLDTSLVCPRNFTFKNHLTCEHARLCLSSDLDYYFP